VYLNGFTNGGNSMSVNDANKLTRRQMLKQGVAATVGVMSAGLVNASMVAGETQRRRQPNVLLIYTDDQNYEHIGCYGSQVYTPYHDSLAREGVRFTRSYSTISICTPSRYSCLTGQYPSRCSHPDFLNAFPDGEPLVPTFNTLLPSEAPNLARVMKEAGYTTGMVGKWHLGKSLWNISAGAPGAPPGEVAKYDLKERGFIPFPWADANWTHTWTAMPSAADPRDPKISKILRHNYDLCREEIKACGFDYAESFYWSNPESWRSHPLNIHNMEWVAQGALDFINQNKDRPFFLYMAPTLHHIPHPQESLLQADPRLTVAGYLDREPDVMLPRPEILERVKAAGYAAETAYCTWLDEGIGAVLNRLEELDLADDTLVIFFSDHQTHAKGTLYEGGVRSPCFIRWRRQIPAGQVCPSLAQNIDFTPTIFDACDVAKPANMPVDGKSLLPMLLDPRQAVHEQLFFEIGWTRAVCTERWKFLALRYSKAAEELAAQRERPLYHNLALEPHQHNVLLEHPNFWDPDQLYDLHTDSIETTNLAYDPSHADTLADMKRRLQGWLETFGDHPFGEFVG